MTNNNNKPAAVDFRELWAKTNRSPAELERNHNYTVGTDETPEFVRVDAYLAAEPHFDDPLWLDWHRVKRADYLGEGRRGRTGRGYTVFPQCEEVNATIIAVASRFFTYTLDSRGLPSEEVRDLCSHLAAKGVRKRADGTLTTYFLHAEAVTYLRAIGSKLSFNQHLLENRAHND